MTMGRQEHGRLCSAPGQKRWLGRWRTKEAKARSSAWGHAEAPGLQVTCQELGVKTPCGTAASWSSRRSLSGRPAPAPRLTQAHPASPSPCGPYAGGCWIHNSALVPIFKRQMRFFFCSILIAKMFNFQTFVFPGKCFRNRNIPSRSSLNACFHCYRRAPVTLG